MQISLSTYLAGNSAIHRMDARVKIVLLPVYSVTLFLIHTWAGMALCAACFIAVLYFCRLSPRHFVGKILIPVYVLLAFTVIFNAFSFDVYDVADPASSFAGLQTISHGETMALFGSFGLTFAGLERGIFFALRIFLLVAMSLIVSYTTTSTALINALSDLFRPLGRLKLPVEDIVMVFNIALRFIPLTALEFCRIHDAQLSRGARFTQEGLWKTISSWQVVFIPLFIALFRRADVLAQAMDGRCWGLSAHVRTHLNKQVFGASSILTLCAGLAICVAVSVLF